VHSDTQAEAVGHSGIRLSTQIKITETLDSEVEALKVEPCRWNPARRSGGAPVTTGRSAHTGLAPGFDPAWVTDASRKKSNKRGSSIEEGGKAVSTPDPSGDAYAP
jgi:hypothetical protein